MGVGGGGAYLYSLEVVPRRHMLERGRFFEKARTINIDGKQEV